MTLKELHQKRLVELREAEEMAQLIVEALDSEELQNATKILKKLGAIKKAVDADVDLKETLGVAIQEAADEVNEFTGGGFKSLLKKGMGALAQKFGAKAGENPILKSLVLLNALERGFGDAIDLIQNSIPDFDASSEQSIIDQSDEKVVKNLRRSLTKAFVPEGIFSKIKSIFGASSGGMPYVKNADVIINGILGMPAKTLTPIIKAATTGPSSNDASNSIQNVMKASKGSKEKKAEEQPVKDVEALASAVATGQTEDKGEDAAAKASEQAASNPKVVVKQLVDFVAKQSKQNADVVEKVLNALLKKGKLRASLTTEGRARISVHDVVEAQMALLECGGSSRTWARLLVEKLTAKQKNAIRDIEAKLASGEIKDEKGIEKLLKPVFGSAPKEQMNKLKKKIKSGDAEDKKPETTATEPAADAGENTSEPTGSGSDSPQQDAGKEEPTATGGEQPTGNHAEVIKSIQDDLKDVDVKSIEAVLDALPEYLRLESLKHYLGVI